MHIRIHFTRRQKISNALLMYRKEELKLHMRSLNRSLSFYIGWGVAVSIFFGFHIYYLKQASPLNPYMDSVRIIGQIHDLLQGEVSWFEVWRLSGPSVFYHLVTLIEWIFWGLNTQVTVIFTAVSWAMIFIIYVAASSGLKKNKETSANLMIAVFALQLASAFVFFSPAGWEIWLLDLGFPQVLKNLIIVIYLYYLSRTDFALISNRSIIVAGMVGSAIVLFVSAGWSYAFTVTVLLFSIVSRKQSPRVFLLSTAVLLSQIIFLYFSSGASKVGAMAIPFDLSGIYIFLSSLFYGFASIFIGSETLSTLDIQAYIVFFLGALFFISSLFVASFFFFTKPDKDSLFFLLCYVFGFFTLLSIAVARGGQGYQFAAASRYFMDYQFIFFGFLGLSLKMLLEQQLPSSGIRCAIFVNTRRAIGIALFFFVVIAVFGHLITYYDEYRKAPYRALAYKAMTSVYLNGTLDDESVRLLQTSYSSLEKALPIFKEYRLGAFRIIEHKSME